MSRRRVLIGPFVVCLVLLTLALPLAAEAAPITDLGTGPAIQMGNLYQATAQALANAAHNATTAQQNAAMTAQSATIMGVATLYALDTATEGTATAKILD
jgi:hypothetical protein